MAMQVNRHAVRALRERSGLTVTSLAEQAGIKQSHLSNIEAGRRKASPEVVIALAKALKVEMLAIVSEPTDMAAA
jgi:transcriptional regulator with XRE-family HTH domain